MYYTHASFFANIPTIVGKEIWNNEQNRKYIMENVGELVFNYQPKHRDVQGTIEMLIKDFLANNFELPAGATDKLYHPSMIETYPNAQRNEFGILRPLQNLTPFSIILVFEHYWLTCSLYF